MKLLFRLSLTVLSFLLILTVLWFSLPGLLVSFANKQLAQQGFSNIEINAGDIGLQSATVEQLKMSNTEFDIKLQNLQVQYNFSGLLSGSVDSIQIGQLSITRIPGSSRSATLPDPALLLALVKTAWGDYVPAHSLTIDNFSLYDTTGVLTLKSSIDIRKQGESIIGDIRLVDDRQVKHQLSLYMSPEKGVDIQLHTGSEDLEDPLSVKLHPAETGNGLSGQANVDLALIAKLNAAFDGLSGKLQADISYAGQAGNSSKIFTLTANIDDAAFAGVQLKGITANLKGNIYENDDGASIRFDESSLLTMQTLQYENSKIGKLVLQLPRSLNIVDGRPVLSSDSGASFILNNVILDNISIAEMQLNNIALTGACAFNMQLMAPVVERGDTRFGFLPVQIDGVCPDSEKKKWSIKANTTKLTVEDTDFQLPLNQCRLQLRNLVDEESLDESAVELSGELSCQSSELSGEVHSAFQFNTETETGHADYTVADIIPDSENPLFSSLLKNWTNPFDIVSGVLSLKGEYRWWKSGKGQDRESLVMALKVNDAGGYYEDILFSGLNYKDKIEILPAIKSSGFADVSVSNIDIGMPITSTSAKIRYSVSTNGPLPLITLNNLNLSLFDGSIQGNDLEIDLNADEHDLILVVVGLDIAQIADMQQLDGLSATGRLDGYIPVTITANGIRISEGRIVAQRQGGRIQYTPTGGTADIEQSAVGSELLFRIIEDLNYHLLNIDVNYHEDGEMDLKLAIKGMSPKVDKNRPVHFNLNLQQNVLKLLRGLRYAEGLSQDIDRNVQKHFRNRENPVN